jgi:hypothetical protein
VTDCHTNARIAHAALERSLHDTTRNYNNRTRWNVPGKPFEADIVASLKAKIDRDTIALAALAATLPPAPNRLDHRPSGEITFKPRTWQPAGSIAFNSDRLGDVPACLQRRRA